MYEEYVWNSMGVNARDCAELFDTERLLVLPEHLNNNFGLASAAVLGQPKSSIPSTALFSIRA